MLVVFISLFCAGGSALAQEGTLGLVDGSGTRAQGTSLDATRFVAGSSFLADTMYARFTSTSALGVMRMAIYAHDGGNPGAVLGDTAEFDAGPGLRSAALKSPVQITEGNVYWIATWVQTASSNVTFVANDNTGMRFRASPTYSATASFPDGSTLNYSAVTTYAVFATGTPDDAYELLGDLDGNCIVDLADLVLFAEQWLDPTGHNDDSNANLDGLGGVDLADFALVAQNWMVSWDCPVIIEGKVKDTKFSLNRGFYEAPFDVTISSATDGATITYTVDGSDPRTSPRATSGTTPVTVNIDPNSDYDGSRPLQRNNLAPSVTLRAYASRSDMEPTNVDTQTYIFLDNVAAQKDVRPTGNHTSTSGNYVFWNSTEMDPELVGPGKKYSVDQVRSSLQSIPTMSIVMSWDDMFGTSGVHRGNTLINRDLERVGSVELIYPPNDTRFAGMKGFQLDAGVRIQGGWGRLSEGRRDHKQSFHLLFRREYGNGKLNYPIFESAPNNADTATDTFDRLILRTGFNDDYGSTWDMDNNVYVSDQMARDLEIAATGYGSHGTFVHLYLNGIYWGIINVVERPDHNFSATYFGGNPEDYLHGKHKSRSEDLAAGDISRWNEWRDNANTTDFSVLQQYIDVDSFVATNLINAYANVGDHPQWYFSVRNNSPGVVRFMNWDCEDSFGGGKHRTGDPSAAHLHGTQIRFYRSDEMWSATPKYRLSLYDQAYKLMYKDGVLTDDRVLEMWNNLRNFIADAMVAETARWGDERKDKHDPPYNPQGFSWSGVFPENSGKTYTTDDWNAACDRVAADMVGRRDKMMNSLRSTSRATYPYYPNFEPPDFMDGSTVITASEITRETGFSLTLVKENSSHAGSIRYTLDGSDPFDSSTVIDGGASTTVTINRSTFVRARLQNGSSWSAANDLVIHVIGGQDLSKLKITELMYHPDDHTVATNVSINSITADAGVQTFRNIENFQRARIRLSSNAPSGLTGGDRIIISGAANPANNGRFTIHKVEGADVYLSDMLAADEGGGAVCDLLMDGDRYEFIEIKNTGTDTLDLTGLRIRGIGYTFPPGTSLNAGAFYVIAKNKAYFNSRYPDITVHGEYDPSSLSNGGERIRLVNYFGETITEVEYADTPPWPLIADGMGYSLVPTDPNPSGSQNDASLWRASANIHGSPGADDPTPPAIPGILVNEILAHTDWPQVDTIELYNPTEEAVDLGGWWLTDNKENPYKYRIRPGNMISAGGYWVIEADNEEYPVNAPPADYYFGGAFRLSSYGEDIYLFSPDLRYSHGFAFGATENGVSLGRYVTSQGDEHFVVQTANSFGWANSGPMVGPVVISEIMYNPANWRKASMERRNAPTDLNYRPEGNHDILYNQASIRGLQIRQPFVGDAGENTMIFHLPTNGFQDVLFRFAAMDEGAAQALLVDYSVAAGTADWQHETELPLLTGVYQLYTIDFSDVAAANDNPDFKVRIRFDVADGQADDGNRVTFNNVSLDAFTGTDQSLLLHFWCFTSALANDTPFESLDATFSRVGGGQIEYQSALAGDPEFIELVNISCEPVALYNSTDRWRVSGVGFTFPEDIVLQPGEVVLLVGNTISPVDFQLQYGVPETVRIFNFTGRLDNDGETIRLRKPDNPDDDYVPYIIVDEVTYDDQAPWPTEPDGGGPSLERIDLRAYGNDPVNWRKSDNVGGTPGLVAQATEPMIAVSPSSLFVTTLQGHNPGHKTIEIWNAGADILSYSISASEDWMQVVAGTFTSAGFHDKRQHTVVFSTSALNPGIHTGVITVASGGAGNAPLSISVVVHVRTPEIAVSPQNLEASASTGQNAPDQAFEVWNKGLGTLNYTVTEDVTWLSVTPTSGTVAEYSDRTLHTVVFNTDLLPVGTYAAPITITDEDASNSPRTINVTLEVLRPQIALSTTVLTPAASVGGTAAIDTLEVWNSSTGLLNYTVSKDADWLNVTPNSGSSTGPQDKASHAVSYDVGALLPGEYSATITISDPEASNSPQTISVVLSISDQTAFAAYNDWYSTNPTAPNVTEYDYTAMNEPLRDFNTGEDLFVTVTGSYSGPFARFSTNGGNFTNPDSDAYRTFNDIVDLTGVYELEAGSANVITFNNLSPGGKYTITLTANRDSSSYINQRFTRVTIEGAESFTNASSVGVVINSAASVSFSTGYNTINGYVAKWTDISPGSDGSFSIKSEWDTAHSGTKGYAMGAFKLSNHDGHALQFDGVSESVGGGYVEIPNSFSLATITDAITIEAWVRMDAWVTGMQIIGKGDRAYSLRRDATNNRLAFMLRDEGRDIIPTVSGVSTGWGLYSDALVLDTWYHVAATWDGTTARIYINGALHNQVATLAGPIGTSADPVHIGCNWNRSLLRRYWNGVIDEVRLWNVARTQTEIEAQMGVELSGFENGLVGYWKFNEGTGLTAFDSSGDGNNGTIVNAEWTTDVAPVVP